MDQGINIMNRKKNKTPDKKFMRLAIREARKNIKYLNGGPFGACIVKNGKVLVVARNKVLCSDATCHAEVNAIKIACRKLKTFDLKGAVIYSTTEPCPMCFSAIHWARINCVVYGTGIEDAAEAGFNELKISAKKLNQLGKAKIKLVGGFLYEECKRLFIDWAKLPAKPLY
jgi:tRNA(Arg) A34 adenosine deaminase TadA